MAVLRRLLAEGFPIAVDFSALFTGMMIACSQYLPSNWRSIEEYSPVFL